jgi:membrane-associated phospholipid phosphatase
MLVVGCFVYLFHRMLPNPVAIFQVIATVFYWRDPSAGPFLMKRFLVTVPRNLIGCFKGWRIVWHVIAIVLTFILVTSGFDWRYFLATRNPAIRSWMWPAVGIGGLLPLALPLILFVVGFIIQSSRTILAGWAVGQAALLGSLVSSAYKAVMGCAHPSHVIGTDISHVFRFGWLRGGVFWGWPSSHATIAFAMAVTVFTLCPKQRWLGFVALLYACYVGLSVSMTIHWFSDFAAGAIVGSVIGTVVGRSFLGKHQKPNVQCGISSDLPATAC